MRFSNRLPVEALIGLTLTGALVAGGGVAANAVVVDATQNEGNRVAAIVSAAAPASINATEEPHPTVDVAIPETVSGVVSLSAGGAPPITIGLPKEVQAGAALKADDASMVYLGDGASPDISVQVAADGARIATVITSADQPASYTYPIDGLSPVVNDDGSVDLMTVHESTKDATGEAAAFSLVRATIEAPWAADANGTPVPTHYEVSKSELVQIVDHSSADLQYPIVADPEITYPNVAQGLVRWDRAETATIASSGWGATGLTAVCAAVGAALGGAPAAATLAAACMGIAGAGVYTAGVAENSNPKKCLQMTVTNVFVAAPIPWFDTYEGGHCG